MKKPRYTLDLIDHVALNRFLINADFSVEPCCPGGVFPLGAVWKFAEP